MGDDLRNESEERRRFEAGEAEYDRRFESPKIHVAATKELQYEAKTGRLVASILAKGWEVTREDDGTFSVLGRDQTGDWDVIALADTLDKVVRVALDEEND